MLKSSRTRSVLFSVSKQTRPHRSYATVSPASVTLGGPPPPPPNSANAHPTIQPPLDSQILGFASSGRMALPARSYLSNSGQILDSSLLHESRPPDARKVNRRSFDGSDILLIAHCVQDGDEHKVTVSSGFALEAPSPRKGESLILTCAHTFEEILRSPLFLNASETGGGVSSGSFVIYSGGGRGGIYPVTEVVSSLPNSDLMIMSCKKPPVASLPVSPYPAHLETRVLAHLVTHEVPKEPGWTQWIGSSWSKWVRGSISGYRDFAGRAAVPGTYDPLSHLLFTPLPTAGSSGSPLIDEETGAVVGVMLGTRMDNRIEGMKGWGVPSETIFGMFSLPGLEGKK
jgi:hypothetical protein